MGPGSWGLEKPRDVLHIFLPQWGTILSSVGRGTGRQSRAPGHQTPPEGVTTRSWHCTEMELRPGPPGVPQPQQLAGVITIPERKNRALTWSAVSALPPAPFLAVCGWQNSLSRDRTQRKFGREGSPALTLLPALQPKAG